MKSSISLKRWAEAAMFTALTLLATSVIKIPTPTFGYIHIGDAFVLLSGIFLGPMLGGLAAGTGSALADLLGGYALWVPGTFVIKFLTAAAAALLFRALRRKTDQRPTPYLIISGIAAELVMTAGYFGYNILMLTAAGGKSSVTIAAAAVSSLAEIPMNLVQGAAGVVLSCLLYPVLVRIGLARGAQAKVSHTA